VDDCWIDAKFQAGADAGLQVGLYTISHATWTMEGAVQVQADTVHGGTETPL
jgi:hypothetical protein